jgi:ornithine carbamoyltransferase
MGISLKERSFISLLDFSQEEIAYLLDLAGTLKAQKKRGIFQKRLADKNVALIFEKPSTRTRCAFVVACCDEGAHPEYLGKYDIQLGHKETIKDTARVLGRMFDCIEFRGFSHEHALELARCSGVPVINGLTDEEHPTQVLADLLTIKERFGRLSGLTLTFVGDGRNNVSNSLMMGCAKMGLHYRVCTPERLFPSEKLVETCAALASENGGSVSVVKDLSGCDDADVIYTDVWASMGEENMMEERAALLAPYQVNADVMKMAKPAAVFEHCLPAVKGKEVTEEVFESKQSVVFDEAENRMHTIKAVLVAVME